MRLLLVEDERRMAQALSEILRQEQYEVDHFEDGTDGLDALKSGIYDAAILDVMLPGVDGYTIVRGARKAGIVTPVLMLTARTELDDKVMGLDSGADDYLTKPFMTKELLARVRALVRRSGIAATVDGVMSYGDITLDVRQATLSCSASGIQVRLGEKENKILEYLITNQGQIMTLEMLAMKIWGYENDAEYNNVEVYMSFTRKKLAFVKAGVIIKAVRGIGYELRYNDVS